MRIAADSGKATSRAGAGTLFEYFATEHLPDTADETGTDGPNSGSTASGNDGLF
jgi:hypothetical protein